MFNKRPPSQRIRTHSITTAEELLLLYFPKNLAFLLFTYLNVKERAALGLYPTFNKTYTTDESKQLDNIYDNERFSEIKRLIETNAVFQAEKAGDITRAEEDSVRIMLDAYFIEDGGAITTAHYSYEKFVRTSEDVRTGYDTEYKFAYETAFNLVISIELGAYITLNEGDNMLLSKDYTIYFKEDGALAIGKMGDPAVKAAEERGDAQTVCELIDSSWVQKSSNQNIGRTFRA